MRCPRCYADAPRGRFCDRCGTQLPNPRSFTSVFKKIGMAVIYLSLAYSGLELSRLILQYITLYYDMPVLPSWLMNLAPPPLSATSFVIELAFVMIGVIFALGMVLLTFYRLAVRFWDAVL